MRPITLAVGSLALALAGCAVLSNPATAEDEKPAVVEEHPTSGYPATAVDGDRAVAVFAGGCFWCVESEFDDLEGVFSAVSGYTGGPEQQPTYSQVSSKQTGHVEAVRVVYDPKVVSYLELAELFWHNIDPFQTDGQFCDRGKPYLSAIFYADESQRAVAESPRAAVAKRFGRDVYTPVRAATTFWAAEEYHQDFHHKSPVHYQSYRSGCGRDRRLAELWGSDAG